MRTFIQRIFLLAAASTAMADGPSPAVAVVRSQDSPPAAAPASANPLSTHNRFMYGYMRKILVGSAQKMAEEHYGFKPAAEVRAFGQIIGHVADSQYRFCSMVLGEKNPARNIEKTMTARADLLAALEDSFTYCDRAYDGLRDASAAEMVKLNGMDTPKLGVLTINNVHTIEHYGNLVTYMRMKGIVPPTSEPGFLNPPKK